jgi:hypothetical protein
MKCRLYLSINLNALNKKTSRNKICLILWRRMEQYKRPKTLRPSHQFALQQALVLLELLLRHPTAKLTKNKAEGALHKGQHHKKQRLQKHERDK